tara:strand:+ start:211 stop:375 length:165 start_codon:yes stop_codon:yes gene_type:complete
MVLSFFVLHLLRLGTYTSSKKINFSILTQIIGMAMNQDYSNRVEDLLDIFCRLD